MYRTIQTDIWGDPWFVDLPPDRKLLFVHLFTNRNVTACGSMQLSTSQIAFETKLSIRKVERELVALGDKVLWLPDCNLIVVRNFYRHQRSQSSENFTKAAKKSMSTLPEVARVWLGCVYPELIDTHPQPIPNPSPTLGDKEEVTVTVAVPVGVAETGVTPLPPEGETEVKTTKPLPENGEAQKIVAAYCREAKLEQPSDYKKSVGIAERMVKAGITAGDIPDLFLFVSRWSDGPDLSILMGSIDKWRTSKNMPARAAPGGPSLPPGFRLPPGWDIGKLEESLAYRNAHVSMPPEREAAVDAYLAAMNGAMT